MDINKLSNSYVVKRIGEEDFDGVLKVMKENPLYFKHCPPFPSIETIKEDLKALPPKKTYEDKYYLGYFKDNELVCVTDYIDKYPNDKSFFIGFFMMNKKFQGKGIAKSIINELYDYLKENSYQEIRLGYVSTNNQAKAFWRSNGFKETGVIDHQELYDVVVMQKLIKA